VRLVPHHSQLFFPRRHAVAVASASGAATAETVDVVAWLNARVSDALVAAFGPEHADRDPLLQHATKPEFGDYQCNVAMPLGKALKAKPRAIAESIAERLDIGELCEPVEIAGPGFLNLKLKRGFVESQLQAMLADGARCAVPTAAPVQRVVVDYSSPNIAKEMHVGHLRSTILGDSLSRILELRGHSVLRLNHVGDWGTQFGMLILHLAQRTERAAGSGAAVEAPTAEELSRLDIGDLVTFYKEAKQRFDEDDVFRERARAEVVKLQGGDPRSLAAWRALCEASEAAFRLVYETLAVDPRLETRGESYYNAQLPGVLASLREAGLLRESAGAQCVFLPGYVSRDGEPQPLIVQKSDGGYMYSTTDLAALRQRVEEEDADRVLYVTDAGQASHFAQVFETGRLAKLVPPSVSLEHVPFGLVLGEDGKKFKTRSGETVKLTALLDEALLRCEADVRARLEAEGRAEGDDFVRRVSRAVGIGAVKCVSLSADLSPGRSLSRQISLPAGRAPPTQPPRALAGTPTSR
jgi:arginyl-tRNA synthetase